MSTATFGTMSTPKTATVRAVEHFGHSALIHCTLHGDAALGQRGGQYVIVDTGLSLADGKRRKRAYSLISADAEQHAFTLAAYGVPGGLGADYMLRLREGDTLTFSGPWGKLVAPVAAADPLRETSARPIWVIATDTGVSAALGLLAGAAFAPHLARTRFAHLIPSDTPFLTADALDARMPPVWQREVSDFPAVGSAERFAEVARRIAGWLAQETPEAVYVTGDGALPERIAAQLRAGGHALPLQCENFFNHPVRKSETRLSAPV